MEDYLTLRATAPWLDAPASLLLPHNGRTFEIKACCSLPSTCCSALTQALHAVRACMGAV